MNTDEVLNFWELELNPFDPVGKTGSTTTQTEASEGMISFILKRIEEGGCSAVLGPIGTGKSTSTNIAFSILKRKPEKYVVIRPLTLATGSLTAPSLLRQIFESHGSFMPRFTTTSRRLEALSQLVNESPAKTVIALDEAHFLGLDTVRLVKEINDLFEKISIILVGHDIQMQTVLKRRESTDLLKRLENGRIYFPTRLTLEDTKRILQQRITLFGNSKVDFPLEVIQEVHKVSDQSPLGVLNLAWAVLQTHAENSVHELNLLTTRKAI